MRSGYWASGGLAPRTDLRLAQLAGAGHRKPESRTLVVGDSELSQRVAAYRAGVVYAMGSFGLKQLSRSSSGFPHLAWKMTRAMQQASRVQRILFFVQPPPLRSISWVGSKGCSL